MLQLVSIKISFTICSLALRDKRHFPSEAQGKARKAGTPMLHSSECPFQSISSTYGHFPRRVWYVSSQQVSLITTEMSLHYFRSCYLEASLTRSNQLFSQQSFSKEHPVNKDCFLRTKMWKPSPLSAIIFDRQFVSQTGDKLTFWGREAGLSVDTITMGNPTSSRYDGSRMVIQELEGFSSVLCINDTFASIVFRHNAGAMQSPPEKLRSY